MHIVVHSPAFLPSLGGLENAVHMLAEQWQLAGHKVTVITETPSSVSETHPYQVLRLGSVTQKIRSIRKADIYLHANISLWGFVPWLLCFFRRPPWVAMHQGWYEEYGEKVSLFNKLKKFTASLASANISASQEIERHLLLNGAVVPNPYDCVRFRLRQDIKRNGDLVFLGRLVSDKGVAVLLNALSTLKNQYRLEPKLSIIGEGPERESLAQLANDLGISAQIIFEGKKTGDELALALNQHRILVVPSLWNEPFGIVALEGMACGLYVIGSSGGGLPEAIGPGGCTFPNGDAEKLAARIKESLCIKQTEPDIIKVDEHLYKHRPKSVADRYLEVFSDVLAKN